jgi:hypothetical protein
MTATTANPASNNTTNNNNNTTNMSSLCLPIRDIISHRNTMFNYKLPSDRSMYESSLIYCNLCDYSCDLTDKSFIICHYLAKHPDDNIVYSYLWPQIEQNQQNLQYKLKYYLIKAHLKIRTKESATSTTTTEIDLTKLEYPNRLLNDEESIDDADSDNSLFVMNKMIDWLEKSIASVTTTTTTPSQTQPTNQEDVQELEEEQEVQEVEMFGEETIPGLAETASTTSSASSSASNTQIDDLVKIASTASFYHNQQRLMTPLLITQPTTGISLSLDNQYLVHLLAINKIENVFRVKQIHDYYGGCFVCGKQVDFNMKHYQTHFNSEMTSYICLHCNYKEYRQEQPGQQQLECCDHNQDLNSLTPEEKLLQSHMTQIHNIDFQQILQQHQQLNQQPSINDSENNEGVVVIESTPMNDMYLSLTIKSLKFIDDDLLRKDEFKFDMSYSCPICNGDTNVYNSNHLNHNLNNDTNPTAQIYHNFENVTFDYLMNHFLTVHQFKAIPLFVCTLCNCARVSLIDCVYHCIRHHFNKKIQIGLCAYNIYDKIQNQFTGSSTQPATTQSNLGHGGHTKKSNSSGGNLPSSASSASASTSQLILPVAATTLNTIYGSGPLVYCVSCNENYSNEPSFIRHSFLSHLMDPNINLNWFKVYTANNGPNTEPVSLQQIAASMALADLNPTTGVDSQGNPIMNEQLENLLPLLYECPICSKSVNSKDSINRHLLYHAINENFEYDITCSNCTKQLSTAQNLAECLLHTREFRSHRLSINFHKYVLSNSESTGGAANPVPMVSCVLCANESSNLIGCVQHLMLDHFGYDSSTIKIKRFVSYMLNSIQKDGLTSSPSNKKLKTKSITSGNTAELQQYFNDSFPSLINETIVSLVTAVSSNNPSLQKPDAFLQEIKCFKCGKFSTKLKQSLFQHLNQHHNYDLKELEKLYEQHIDRQIQIIDQQQLLDKFQEKQKDVLVHQQQVFKDTKDKNDQLYQKQLQQQKIIIQQQLNEITPMEVVPNEIVAAQQQIIEPQNQQQQSVVVSTQPAIAHQHKSSHHHHKQQHQQQQQQQQPAATPAQIDKIHSTIDQVLSQICKDDYENQSDKQQEMIVDQSQYQQQITVTAQPPEAENLFVFKCNLCEPFTTDDATQLLEHYKIMHQVELTIADSSTLLAAAVAAFQTGHTIEMTGAILNTISSVTDENGLTIISGEEVPVHTTVQYKCTICQMIFYEKQFIVQHLYDMHNFEIDISYFEEIELQQQEQLQQKIYEQQQEQLLLQQQQQHLEQQQQNLNDKSGVGVSQQETTTTTTTATTTQHHETQQQTVATTTSASAAAQPATLIPVGTTTTTEDGQPAVMMMMMNSNQPGQPASGILLNANQVQQIISQQQSGNVTDLSSIVAAAGGQIISAQPIEALPLSGVTPTTAIPITTADGTVIHATTAIPVQTVPTPAQSQPAKPTINYSCTYCTFGADKLKKMSDHLKQSHPLREKTCMDNVRHQLIRLPNEDLPPYNQAPPTVGSLLQQQQQLQQQLQKQQQQQQQSPQAAANGNKSSLMDNLSSSLINFTSSLAAADSTTTPKNQQQSPSSVTKKRGPKPKTSPNRPATTLKQQIQQQQQQQAANNIKNPTILTMDANSQIIIDFNQNDDLLCSYCDYTMNNLNYMRTHIKYKHKNMPITFQNKLSSRFYTIVEWPLTSVPTLTPAGSSQTSTPASTTTPTSNKPTEPVPSTPTQDNSNNKTENASTPSNETVTPSNQPVQTSTTTSPLSTTTSTTPTKKTSSTKENHHDTSSIRHKISTAQAQQQQQQQTQQQPQQTTQAGGISINTNNVNTILKKLGVNVTSGSTSISNLISSIGSGTKTVNNSVVNVNLNVLKDVNIDEMTDDDDDEERKFLIKELEKKANSKKGTTTLVQSTGYTSDGTCSSGTTPGGIKRSRSNSSTRNSLTNTTTIPQPVPTALTPTSTNISTNQSQQQSSQLNITLNCHYCWAQFQLNVTKNLKNSIQQKENGKYMQHLALHLNAPYKCNECAYPITDTKTFLKHKQFYKHDEKTCIMVDNDINIPASLLVNQTTTRRKTLIAHRLRQHHQNKESQQQLSSDNQVTSTNELVTSSNSNEIQFNHDRDSYQCSLCYGEHDPAPSTSVSTLNKSPTSSISGASNFSFDKEQVIKHVLIVHLSFLAYKCDTCSQFYAFDEPQTKQHAALVHHCGSSGESSATCHFKLIKTEEEINLAINRAQQFITKVPAATIKKSDSSTNMRQTRQQTAAVTQSASTSSSSNVSIEAQPKYKCCKCSTTSTGNPLNMTQLTQLPTTPIVLYSYQDALDHVMNAHLQQQNKKDKKAGYELELFEQNLEDLLASETGIVTTVSSTSLVANPASSSSSLDNDDEDDDNDEENGQLTDDFITLQQQQGEIDLNEWNVILSEPFNLSTTPVNQLQSPQLSGNKRKRFKTNNNTSITLNSDDSIVITSGLFNNKKLKKFFFKPYLIYKCQLCNRKMNQFDINHWLQHDQENHFKLFNSENMKSINYQHVTGPKQQGSSNGLKNNLTSPNQQTTSPSATAPVNSTHQISYTSLNEFYQNYKKDIKSLNQDTQTVCKLIGCLICGTELKYTYADILKHFQSEHELNIFDLLNHKLTLDDLDLIHTLQLNNQVQLSQGCLLKRSCFIKIPPQLLNPQAGANYQSIARLDLIDKEIKLLNEIYREQIVDKQIVSWLNSEQFLRRNFNYNSYVCIICNATKLNILETHYNLHKKTATPNNNNTNSSQQSNNADTYNRLQYYSDEMKTVVLTNHILSHFNEYCYRCMSCKISWPDRTQLLKHAQECSNSQVVRTKTKYKLKANCRSQLKFYLQTYTDYWQTERSFETKSIEHLMPTQQQIENEDKKLNCKVFIKDIIQNKKLLLETSSRSNLNKINLNDNKKLIVVEEEEQELDNAAANESIQMVDDNNVSMKDEQESIVTSTK